jgi:pSer/pThr/pTyr-binding forkhead associated (FHA) protein
MTKPSQAPYFIELLTPDKSLRARYRFEQLPIRIGRGYDNDLILDDPYIATHHAIIEQSETGDLHLRDLGSKNGLVHLGKRQSQVALNDDIIRLGHTNIRVRDVTFKVKNELTDTAAHSWEGWPPALTGVGMITLSVLISTWLSLVEKSSAVNYISAIALTFCIVLIWCGCWAFANRVISIGGQTRFGRHLFIVGCATLIYDLWDVLSITFAYAFSLEFLTRYGNHIAMAIMAGMIFFHLCTVNHQYSKRFLYACMALSAIGSGLILMNNYQRSGQLADELYMTHLLPPALRQSPNQSIDLFIADAKKMKAALDQSRLKPANNNENLLDDNE